MKKFSSESRFSSFLLATLLVMGILGVFFSLYNKLTSLGETLPFWSATYLSVTLIVAIILIGRTLSLINNLQSDRLELKSLKQTLKQSQEKSDEEEKTDDVKVVIDHDTEAKSLMPTDTMENLENFSEALLSGIAKKMEIVLGVMFLRNNETKEYSYLAGYAYYSEDPPPVFPEGETLPGQVAKNKEILNLDELPPDYITILSGLGKGSPRYLIIIPVLDSKKECIAVIELASFKQFTSDQVTIFSRLSNLVGEHISTIANSIQE